MFDFFDEISENAGQLVTIGNYFISGVTNFVSAVRNNEAFSNFLSSVSLFPAPIASLVLPYVSMKIFEFVRGR